MQAIPIYPLCRFTSYLYFVILSQPTCVCIIYSVFYTVPTLYVAYRHIHTYISLSHLRVTWRDHAFLLLNTWEYIDKTRVFFYKTSPVNKMRKLNIWYNTVIPTTVHIQTSSLIPILSLYLFISPVPESPIAFSRHVPSASFNLEEFLSLALHFLSLTFLTRSGQFFCRIDVAQILFAVSSWLVSGYAFLLRLPQRRRCISLSTTCGGTVSIFLFVGGVSLTTWFRGCAPDSPTVHLLFSICS